MSGPIVRKYGFPNFEKIFGERDLKHGAEGEPSTAPSPESAANPAKSPEGTATTKDEPGPSKA